MLLCCNSKRIKDLAKISVAPGIFGINEPIIFGLPIVLNPVMLIPFILTPVVNIIIAYFIMDLGLVPLCNGVMLPWTTPPLVSGFLLSGWQGAVLQLFLIILGIFIYLPFIKTLDKEYLKEEAAASEESSTELEDFDSIDLDSVVL